MVDYEIRDGNSFKSLGFQPKIKGIRQLRSICLAVGLLGMPILGEGCSSPNVDVSNWSDTELVESPIKGLSGFTINLNSQSTSTDLKVNLCFNNKGRARFVEKEENPKYEYVEDQVFNYEPGCYSESLANIKPPSEVLIYIDMEQDSPDLTTVTEGYMIRINSSNLMSITTFTGQRLAAPGLLKPFDDSRTRVISNFVTSLNTGPGNTNP